MNVPQVPLCNCGALLLSVGGVGNVGDGFFRGKRFLCLRCGGLYAGAPREQPSTLEAENKITNLETEFMVNCGSKLFAIGTYWLGCANCDAGEEHIRHAPDRDWRELNDALKWLSDRTGKEFGMVNGDLGHWAELTSAATAVGTSGKLSEILGGGI